MPELPEVETVRRGLARCMTGRQIVRAELRRPDLRWPFPPMLAERLHGARIGALARGGEVLVSSTVKDLVVGSELRFTDRGAHALRGVPGEWRVYALAE
jgi:formamidopyrimidine-DNA glycosylase